ncbi:MAG: type VI secretion system ImpA family N-terminal domain-containing protein [Rubrivivax sp.]
MSDLDSAAARWQSWLNPLSGDAGVCGPDLEYDNDFLALLQSAAGKPETQFSAAEPANWRGAFEQAQDLLDRSRDLRIAILWTRAGLHLHGFAFLPTGLQLIDGLAEQYWEQVHPQPDPDDGDPYPRVNALALLRENDGVVGDLRQTFVVNDRAIGELTGRQLELALGLASANEGEAETSRDVARQMLAAAVERAPQLRVQAEAARELSRVLAARLDERLGTDAPDLKPLLALVDGVVRLLPASATDRADADDPAADGVAGGAKAGLSGGVRSREEALRAIDMVRDYLERAEPSNPASLFLRRAQQLISHNFLQLMKELAPDAMGEVARIVGVDPDSVQTPEA